MYYAVDAIERGTARLVDDEEQTVFVPLDELPFGTAETDVLEWRDGVWSAAPEETQRRKERAAALLRHLLGG